MIEPAEESSPAFGMTKIPDVKDIIVGELAERGDWVVANVDTTSYWPVNSQKVMFRGETVWILPIMKNYFPAVAMKVPTGKSRADCEKLLMRFLSTLAWVEEKGFLVDGIGGGSLPAPMGREKSRGFSICEEYDLSYFPEPTDDKALLAMALMREGRGLNHPGYAFLSFYRVLEVAFPTGKKRGEWIGQNVDAVRGFSAREALKKLQAQGLADIGAHLYESGRCAMAHAREEPIIDPDEPSDARRLWAELPIMTELAQMAIEQVFGVEAPHTVYQNHLYELDGFKKLLGSDIVEKVTKGEQIADGRIIDIPNVSVQLRRREPYAPLSNLLAREIGQTGHVLDLLFSSEDDTIKIHFRLNFAEERLEFNYFDDLAAADTGTPESAERMAEISRFSKEYFGNGQLQIRDAETGELISRKDAFIPVNTYLDHKAADADIQRWKQLAAERRDAVT